MPTETEPNAAAGAPPPAPARPDDRAQRLMARAALWVVFVVAALWLAHETAAVLLVFLFALVLAVVLNAPVTWLEDRGLRRVWAALLVLGAIAVLVALLAWLVAAPLIAETAGVLRQAPEYAAELRERVRELVGDHPAVEAQLPLDTERAAEMMPDASTLLTGFGRYSLSLLAGVAAVLVAFAIVLYALLRPRPLLRLYLGLFPPRLAKPAAEAFSRASVMLVGWLWSNVLVGAMEAVLVGVVLSLLGVPGALTWAALALFAELVPKVGLYLMAAPPILVALATEPMTALWVAIFYMVMSEVMSDFVMPRVRSATMDIHPVSVLFVMLVMAAAFGLPGALIATPVAALVKAYYEVFYLERRPLPAGRDERVDDMLHRRSTTQAERT